MFGLMPFQFRFRGKTRRLLDIYACFLDADGKALHPAQIARKSGISLGETSRRLEMTGELFVKLPRRTDGFTRYRLTTAATSLGEDGVIELINRNARRETLVLVGVGTMIALLGLIMLVVMVPAL